MNVFHVLFLTVSVAWLIYAVGYPIYKKRRKESVFGDTPYATILCLLALFMNIFSFLSRCIK